MKKFLFATLSLAGLAFLTTSAQAGCERVLVGYDRFGHPVYQEVYTQSYYQPRPVCVDRAPVRYQSYDYGRGYSYGRGNDYGRSYQRSECRTSRPRFSISFGF